MSTSPKKHKILIAEDEPSLLEMIAKRVVDAGFTAIKAHDGEEAIDLALKEKPDAAIVDVIMPLKNGFDVIKELRKHSSNLPIMIVTNLESDLDRETGSQLGVKHYILKSNITMRQLQQQITELVST